MKNVSKLYSIKKWLVRKMGGVPSEEIVNFNVDGLKAAEVAYLLNTTGFTCYLLSNQGCIKRYGDELWGVGNGFRRIAQNSDRELGPHAAHAIKALRAETSSELMSLSIALGRIIHFNLANTENHDSLFHPDGTRIWDEALLEESRKRAEKTIQESCT